VGVITYVSMEGIFPLENIPMAKKMTNRGIKTHFYRLS
jgi:hypothetical protein